MAKRSAFLHFSPPYIGDDEIDEVVDTLRSDWITTGPKTRAFEAQFGRYVGAPDGASLMLNSCTAGLHLALVALGIGVGDEVILPTMTFAATANVVEHVGARPVLVDVLPDTLCIDPDMVRRAVTDRTKAIMPVHYAGHPAELDEIASIADEHGLSIVEDAAHAVPTDYRDTRVGSRANFAAFSFYATKNLTTAEGGALTASPELLERARIASLHGMSRDAWRRYEKGGSWQYDIVMPGFKYNMTDIQAALGAHQLRRLDGFVERRRAIVESYNAAFSGLPRVTVPIERPYSRSSWHLYVLRVAPPIDRNQFIDELGENNIGTSVHYTPLHMMSYYADKYGYSPSQFPVAFESSQRVVSLPLHPRLSDDDVQDVIDAVTEAAARAGP